MAIENFRLYKTYFKLLTDAIANDFVCEMSLSVSNRLPSSLHSFNDSFPFRLTSYYLVFDSFTWRFQVSNSEWTVFLTWLTFFITCNGRHIIRIFLVYSEVLVYILTVIVFWYGWESGWNGDRKFFAYMIIIFFGKYSH